jgi:hypothetical protein
MHDFVHEATHELLHLDGKILQTVKLLVAKPGELTREFLAGRRARYISPVRVYLTFSLIFFTLAAVLPRGPRPMVRIDNTRPIHAETEFQKRIVTALEKGQREGKRLSDDILQNLPKVAFVLMPIFGLLTWALYRRQQRYYIAHLYYSIHFHAFVFLVMSASVLLGRTMLPRGVAAPLLLATVPYHFLALRRVFGGSWGKTLAKGLAIGLVYSLLAAAAVLTLTFYLMLRL